jgi:hypothetical protein
MLYSADYSTNSGETPEGENGTEMRVAKVQADEWRVGFRNGTSELGRLVLVFWRRWFLDEQCDVCFWVCATLLGNFLFGFQQFTHRLTVVTARTVGAVTSLCNAGSGVGGYYSAYWHPPVLPHAT